VRIEICSVGANDVIGDAQVDGLGRIRWADCDHRLIDRTHKPLVGFSEQGDRGDVVSHIGRHWVRYALRRSIGYDTRCDETHYGRALGKSAEN
jgi:hypothetical protein